MPMGFQENIVLLLRKGDVMDGSPVSHLPALTIQVKDQVYKTTNASIQVYTQNHRT